MSLLDPTWKYTRSEATDIRKTFARVKKEQKRSVDLASASSNVPAERPAPEAPQEEAA